MMPVWRWEPWAPERGWDELLAGVLYATAWHALAYGRWFGKRLAIRAMGTLDRQFGWSGEMPRFHPLGSWVTA